jgi:hypothetical protein
MSTPQDNSSAEVSGQVPGPDFVTLYVDLREGPCPVEVPARIAGRLRDETGSEPRLERGLAVAALVIVRLGHEAGEALLDHWLRHDPGLILEADTLFVETLAFTPELLTGPLVAGAA